MLKESERDIVLDQRPPAGATEAEELAARSLIGTKGDLRASGTFNRTVFGDVSGTLNTEVEHTDGRSLIGLGDTFATVWLVLRWPLALVVAMLIYAIVFYAAPNVEVRHFRWITPGAVVGVVLWIVVSAVFFVYVSNFSSYSATYGAFAGAVILLVWLWVTNLAFLFGAELNAVVDLRRAKYLPEAYDGPEFPTPAG